MTEPVLKRPYSQIEPLQQFYRYLQARALSPATQRIYKASLARWRALLPDLLAPARSHVEAWVRARRGTVGVSTFNQELSAVRAFYRWAVSWEYADPSTLTLLPRSHRAPKRLPRNLTEHEVGRLLAEPDLSTLVRVVVLLVQILAFSPCPGLFKPALNLSSEFRLGRFGGLCCY